MKKLNYDKKKKSDCKISYRFAGGLRFLWGGGRLFHVVLAIITGRSYVRVQMIRPKHEFRG